MSKNDVRWVQRLKSYCRALDDLKSEVEMASDSELSLLEKKGIIKSFEIVQELAWKMIKDFFESIGEARILGSKDAFNLAFKMNLVSDENGTLLRTVESRNNTVHMYNQEIAEEIFREIVEEYYDAFEQLREALLKEKDKRGL